MYWILLLLATLPSIIIFGPLLILALTTRRFNITTGAICDLNNFRSARAKFIILLALNQLTQVLFLALRFPSLFTYQDHLLMVLILVSGITGLFISSHTVTHTLLILFSYSLLVILMIKATTLLIPAYILIILSCTLGLRLGIALVLRRKCHFWVFEYLILGLFGLWNIAMLYL